MPYDYELKGGQRYAKNNILPPEVESLVSGGQYRDIPASIVPDVLAQRLSVDQAVSRITGTPLYDPTKGPQVNIGGGNINVKEGDTVPGLGTYSPEGKFVPPPPSLSDNSYTIKTGDELRKIAAANNISLSKLLQLNPQFSKNPNLILPGQKVTLPPKIGAPTSAPGADQTTVQDYLSSISNAPTSDTVKRTSFEIDKALKESLAPSAAPAAPSASTKTAELISQYLTPAENEYNSAKSDLENVQNTILAEADKIKGDQVSSAVIGKRLVKLDADTAETLRQAQSRVNNAADRLNSQTKVVSMMQDAYKWDYSQAQSNYQFEYGKNVQLFSLLQTAQGREQDDARANLQMVWNLMKTNNLSYENLPKDQQALIQKFEGMLGYQGLSKFLTANVKGDIVSTSVRTDSSGNDYFDVLTKGADGSLSVSTIYRGKSKITGEGGKTADEQERDRIKEFTDFSISVAEKIKSRILSYEAGVAIIRGRFPEFSEASITGTLSNQKPITK